MKIPIFGNGDIDSPQKAVEYKNRYGVDGVMIGRATIGAPWFFRDVKHYIKTGEILPPPSVEERVAICRKHLHTSIDWKGEKLGIVEMRRHYANYLKGLSHAKQFRNRLVDTMDVSELDQILDEVIDYYGQEENIIG